MKSKNSFLNFQLHNLITLIGFLLFSLTVAGQNTESSNENKGYLGVGVGSILHLDNENNIYGVGINSFFEGSYFISSNIGVSAQFGFNKFNVSSQDDFYLLLENSEFSTWYATVDNNNINSEPGINMGYVIGGPIFTYPANKINFDFSPKAGVAFASPFYQYEYIIEGYSNAGYYDRDVVSYQGDYTTSFLLDIELAMRAQLTDSGLGFKFFTKYIHSTYTSSMTRSHTFQSRDYPGGSVEQELNYEESSSQKVDINCVILGLSLIYSFK